MNQRVDLRFNDRPVRVPQGVTLFDAASWNGIAIDSKGNVYVAENRGRRVHKFRIVAE